MNEKLRKLYIRTELQTGYYDKHNGKDMITLGQPGYQGADDNLLQEIAEAYLNAVFCLIFLISVRESSLAGTIREAPSCFRNTAPISPERNLARGLMLPTLQTKK